MLKRFVVAGSACVSVLAACSGEPDSKPPLESEANGQALRAVDIIVTGQSSATYEARSYPNHDFNEDATKALEAGRR